MIYSAGKVFLKENCKKTENYMKRDQPEESQIDGDTSGELFGASDVT